MIVDGSGRPGRRGDVGVIDGRIVAVGEVDGRGREELSADGQVVAPGFVDAHTHMDAQVFWDDLGRPTCWHGVTSVVMGNCGFTLAPVRPEERELAVRSLERAEDIAPEAMEQGIDWTWSSFAEFMDAVDAVPKGVNYAASIGHSALRTFAMGERAFEGEADDDDVAAMSAELRSALQAGVVGFSTSRSVAHMTSDDRPVASRLASWAEVVSLVDIVGKESDAVFELAQERFPDERQQEFESRLMNLALTSGAPIAFGKFAATLPEVSLRTMEATAARGGEMYGLTHCRGIMSAHSFLTRLGFDNLAEWQEVRSRPLDEQRVLLRDPAVRERLVHAAHHGDYGVVAGPEASKPDFERMTILVSPYLPNPTVADEARRRGVDPVEAMVDIALERDFNAFFLQPLVDQTDDDALLELMRHPQTAMCFSDSGAHVSQIFDSSIFTHLLAYWVREREALTIEEAVRMMTSKPAEMWRLRDRGRLGPGYAADITIFDPDTVAPRMPSVVADLPGGAKRIEQQADGIAATIVNGAVLTLDGEPAEARPGRLLRLSR